MMWDLRNIVVPVYVRAGWTEYFYFLARIHFLLPRISSVPAAERLKSKRQQAMNNFSCIFFGFMAKHANSIDNLSIHFNIMGGGSWKGKHWSLCSLLFTKTTWMTKWFLKWAFVLQFWRREWESNSMSQNQGCDWCNKQFPKHFPDKCYWALGESFQIANHFHKDSGDMSPSENDRIIYHTVIYPKISGVQCDI